MMRLTRRAKQWLAIAAIALTSACSGGTPSPAPASPASSSTPNPGGPLRVRATGLATSGGGLDRLNELGAPAPHTIAQSQEGDSCSPRPFRHHAPTTQEQQDAFDRIRDRIRYQSCLAGGRATLSGTANGEYVVTGDLDSVPASPAAPSRKPTEILGTAGPYQLNKPIYGVMVIPDGGGLTAVFVARDGGVFSTNPDLFPGSFVNRGLGPVSEVMWSDDGLFLAAVHDVDPNSQTSGDRRQDVFCIPNGKRESDLLTTDRTAASFCAEIRNRVATQGDTGIQLVM